MIIRLKALYCRFRHIILYGAIGSLCSALDFSIFSLLCLLQGLPYLWANIFSTHVGIFASFWLNRSYNFKMKDKTPIRFLSFYAVGLIGLGLSSLCLWLMVDTAKWNELLCKLITIVLVAFTQFILNKYITFRKKI